MPVENASATNLGGGATEGGEPDIFAGASDAPVEETPAEETPAEETPVEEAPAEGAEETPAEETPVEDEEETPAEGAEEEEVEGEGEKTPEQLAADKKAAADAAAKKKPQTEAEKEMEKTLTEAYREHPKLKEALKAYPDLRAPFFKAAQLNKLYPTIQEAEKAKQWAMDLFNIDKMYYGGTADKQALQKLLWEENLDRDGKSTGHYEQLQELFTSDTLVGLEKAITQNPTLAAAVAAGFKPEQATVAIEVVRRLIQAAAGRPLTAGAGVGGRQVDASTLPIDTTNMTPRERQLAEENARLKSAHEEFTRTQAATSEQEFNRGAYDLFYNSVKPEIDRRMPSSVKGNQFYEKAFANEVLAEVHKQLRADTFFDAQLEAAVRAGNRGPEHRAQIAEMIQQRAQLLIPGIARQLAGQVAAVKTAAAGTGAGAANANSKGQGTSRNRGTERPRREPALGSTPGRLSKPGVRTSGTPERQSGMKSSGDYSRDADKILGIE